MEQSMRIGLHFLLCVGVLLLASCKSKSKLTIVGKWDSEKGGFVEFRPDGTVLLSTSEKAREGKYKLADERTIELEFQLSNGPFLVHWTIESITENQLTVNAEGRNTAVFRRAK
jgi:hypothetical protein